ncbi:MAG: phosphoenolpyruvate--protein phosphotransferase [Proteobacteria bacterium]|nr:MAG: phosphoenolpyruvate--protein phosphotransferase [Pseudomonadota bacterium]
MAGDNTRNDNLGVVLQGEGVSEGIVMGNAVRWDRTELLVEHVRLPQSLVELEIARFHDAVARAEQEIDGLYESLVHSGMSEGEHLGLLDAHKMTLHDPMIQGDTERYIREEHLNAEWALSMTLKRVAAMFSAMSDPFFRERGQDIIHIGHRLHHFLARSSGADGLVPTLQLQPGSVLVAKSLSPAEAIAASRQGVSAMVLESGTAQGHTAIIARSVGIPAVIALTNATDQVGDGDRVIVDGFEGEIVVHPSQYEELLYSRRANRAKAVRRTVGRNKALAAQTPDGYEVKLRCNLDFAKQAFVVDNHGGRGVGLFRTEFLYLERAHPPTEQEQCVVYSDILEASKPHPVSIRTLDVGGDKAVRSLGETPKGLRAIRYCLANEDLFLTQLRALLRAARHGHLRILLPFITTPGEIRQVKRLLQRASAQLRAEGVDHRADVPIGAMIEVPAAALAADLLACEVDYFSVGTNDLMRYTMAVSRESSTPEYLRNPLHPGFLRMLKLVTQAGQAAGIPVAICGEMASKPRYAPVLLALGFNELSMTPESVPLVKEVIRRTPRSDALAVYHKVLDMRSAVEAKDYLDSYMVEHYPELVQPRFRGAPHYAR